ncbi:MAG: DUF2628 domain-containing protein [Syntrophomonadaceae bacterium]|nr:DUF2628 domain-containing protein [Syntrophomonadaceae bacterium]
MNLETHDWVKKSVNLNTLFFDYYGMNAEKYVAAQEYFENNPGKFYWNWSAALLGPIWLFYRKMYKPLNIWLIIGMAFNFVYFASPLLDSDATNPLLAFWVNYYGWLSLLYILGANIIAGCWGTYYYLQQARRLVELVKAGAPDTIAAVILAEKGNPSKWRVAGGVLLLCGIYLISYLSACLWLILR